jgi:hypothetical protein
MDVSSSIAKWERAELKERSAAPEHVLDLCDLIGHPRPAAAGPKGEWFAFEKGTARRGGDTGAPDESVSQGWCDVWKRAFFAIEYKGKHKDLGAAWDRFIVNPRLPAGVPGGLREPDTTAVEFGLAQHAVALARREAAGKRPVGPGDVGVAGYPRLVPRDAESAKALARRTLTALYNQRPPWLELAQRRLGEAVSTAYGWPVDLPDQHVPERLLGLNQTRAAGSGA